jgi:hypothetical protein
MLVYRDQSEPFRDVDLFAMAALLEYFIEEGRIEQRLSSLVTSWKDACVMNSGPGTIDFDFSALDADPLLAEQLRTALAWSDGEIKRRWGLSIPGTVLNRRCSSTSSSRAPSSTTSA